MAVGVGTGLEQQPEVFQQCDHLPATAKRERCCTAAITILVMAYEYPDSVLLDRVEAVLVGQVVTEVDRHTPRPLQSFDDPLDRVAACSTVFRGAARRPCGPVSRAVGIGGRSIARRPDSRDMVVGDVTKVHRDRRSLVLDEDSRERTQRRTQCPDRGPQSAESLVGSVVAVDLTVRAHDVEAVRPCVPQAGDADPVPDVAEFPAADHGNRA